MSWFKHPQGKDDQMAMVLKVIGVVAFLVVLKELHEYLEVKLEGKKASEVAASTFGNWLPSVGEFFFELLLISLFFVLIVTAVVFAVYLAYRRSAEKNVKYIRILPRVDIGLDPDKIMSMIKGFGTMKRHFKEKGQLGPLWFRLRFAMLPDSQEIGIYLAYPSDKQKEVYDAIKIAYPRAELIPLDEKQFPGPEPGGRGGYFIHRTGLPLASMADNKKSEIGSILATLRRGTYIDIHFSPVEWQYLNKRFDKAEKGLKNKKMTEMEPEEKARKVALTKRATEKSLAFKVRMTIWSNKKEETDQVVNSVANRIISAMKDVGSIHFKRRKRKIFNFMLDRNLIPYPLPFTFMIWANEELANLFHLPPGDHLIYQEPKEKEPRGYLAHLLPYEIASYDGPKDGVKIGKLVHPRDKDQIVKLSYDQLRNHFVLTGSKGMGRVSAAVEMLQSMIDEWIENPDQAPGFTIIDPAREIIPIIENRLRKMEKDGKNIPKEKIHYYDLSDDTTNLIGLNFLHKIDGMPVNEMAERIARILMYDRTMFDGSQNQNMIPLQRILTLAIHALLLDDQPHTLLEVEYMMTNEAFRKQILKNIKDPYVRHYWSHVGGKEWKKEVQPLLNLIEPLLQDPTTRRIYLQREMALDIRKYMDDGHLVMIDLKEMKSHELKVTVGYLVYLYHQIGRRRPSDSKFHLIMIDEAHRLQIPIFTILLNEDERHNHGMGLVTREIDHFKNEELIQAIKANIGVVMSCAQEEGADEVEKITRERIRVQDVEKLPERTMMVYVRGKEKQRAQSKTYKVRCSPPYVFDENGKEVDHSQKSEVERAHQLGIEWGREIMRNSPEARPLSELDEEISNHMEEAANIS
ncbi:hypothetical protein [Thermoflavimicrobium dichotomicum]|uniref:Helicase HerA central domain-containing protein n=1 Tax=Thermoflavimicrobium dichotomicum TaxID=46223 RepID=A0A1I3LVG1_9BACL|nr:hypothetical protein [Thermoflavimicrobium dichotomicum]SFI88754.1 hypothetical protein SAMN05421852_102338 [Thermoflavimicrobium dichotomicum]